jgi:hypothetical protein
MAEHRGHIASGSSNRNLDKQDCRIGSQNVTLPFDAGAVASERIIWFCFNFQHDALLLQLDRG